MNHMYELWSLNAVVRVQKWLVCDAKSLLVVEVAAVMVCTSLCSQRSWSDSAQVQRIWWISSCVWCCFGLWCVSVYLISVSQCVVVYSVGVLVYLVWLLHPWCERGAWELPCHHSAVAGPDIVWLQHLAWVQRLRHLQACAWGRTSRSVNITTFLAKHNDSDEAVECWLPYHCLTYFLLLLLFFLVPLVVKIPRVKRDKTS